MTYFVYILYSEKIDKYYIGYTSDLTQRLDFHNSIEKNKIWSKRGIPWNLVFSHQANSKSDALKLEKFIKRQKSRSFVQRIIADGLND